MTDPTRDHDQLLGYLLDALEDDEQFEVERHLEDDAQLQHELAVLSKALAPLDATWRDYSPPPGLATRTCQSVEAYRRAPSTGATLPPPAPPIRPMSPVLEPPSAASLWRFQDLVMVAGVLLAASVLLFPALHGSRVQARLLACQNNLRELGVALTGYSERHGGFFPAVATEGNLAVASAFGPLLVEDQCLEDPSVLVCPGSALAEQQSFSVPRVAEVEAAAPGKQLRQLQETMGGSYGYTLGVQEDGQQRPLRNLRRAHYALASDAPSHWLPNHQSENHGRYGQNVLFEDGHVRFVTSPCPNDVFDDLFENDHGEVAAGVHLNDSVIAAGATPPIRYASIH